MKDLTNIKDLYKKIPSKAECNIYRFHIECDANDGDYVRNTFDLSPAQFENNILLQYVISYVCEYVEYSQSEGIYGQYIEENIHFDWLERYCSHWDLLLSNPGNDCMCHSIVDIEIEYYDCDGQKFTVEIPSFKELLEKNSDLIQDMNELYRVVKNNPRYGLH